MSYKEDILDLIEAVDALDNSLVQFRVDPEDLTVRIVMADREETYRQELAQQVEASYKCLMRKVRSSPDSFPMAGSLAARMRGVKGNISEDGSEVYIDTIDIGPLALTLDTPSEAPLRPVITRDIFIDALCQGGHAVKVRDGVRIKLDGLTQIAVRLRTDTFKPAEPDTEEEQVEEVEEVREMPEEVDGSFIDHHA